MWFLIKWRGSWTNWWSSRWSSIRIHVLRPCWNRWKAYLRKSAKASSNQFLAEKWSTWLMIWPCARKSINGLRNVVKNKLLAFSHLSWSWFASTWITSSGTICKHSRKNWLNECNLLHASPAPRAIPRRPCACWIKEMRDIGSSWASPARSYILKPFLPLSWISLYKNGQDFTIINIMNKW